MLCLSCCHSLDKTYATSVYQTQNSSQILVSDGQRSYLGTGSLPPGSDILQDYGTPAQVVHKQGVRCVILSGLAFAFSEQNDFSCNGYKFHVVRRDVGIVIIHASCNFVTSPGCKGRNLEIPDLEYSYGYRRGRGVDWVTFGDGNGRHPEDTLRHVSGARILAPLES